VPPAAYIAVIIVETVGVIGAFLLNKPERIVRCDGRPIARFHNFTWIQEVKLLFKDILTPKILLLAPAFLACNMPVSLTGSLNGFHFNARTRTLINVSNSKYKMIASNVDLLA
jgi:hypothetical protein